MVFSRCQSLQNETVALLPNFRPGPTLRSGYVSPAGGKPLCADLLKLSNFQCAYSNGLVYVPTLTSTWFPWSCDTEAKAYESSGSWMWLSPCRRALGSMHYRRLSCYNVRCNGPGDLRGRKLRSNTNNRLSALGCLAPAPAFSSRCAAGFAEKQDASARAEPGIVPTALQHQNSAATP